jgi:hypothetical protein
VYKGYFLVESSIIAKYKSFLKSVLNNPQAQVIMENITDSSAVDAKLQRRRDLQKRSRRKKNLINKAVQMSILCDAEVYLGIRIKDTGRVTTFCSHPAGIWSSTKLVCLSEKQMIAQLICKQEGYYPIPTRMTLEDFVKKDDSSSEESMDKEKVADED